MKIAQELSTARPNILFITCDQLRADALGCYGNAICRTPNIDRLAAMGTTFTECHTAYPVCAPNRATLATGRYPSIHGVTTNGIPLPHEEVTMMDVLRGVGYRTYGAGKMHFGPQWAFPPDGARLKDPRPEWAVDPQPADDDLPWHGFERVAITEDNRVGPYGRYLAAHGYDVWSDPHSFTYPQHITQRSVYPEEHHQTTWVADRSIEFLRAHPAADPFFLWTSFVDPHHPFTPPAPFDEMYTPAEMPLPKRSEEESAHWPQAYQRKFHAREGSHEAIGMDRLADSQWQRIKAFYYGMVSLIDKQVGRILDCLREIGAAENTIVVLTADHGEMLGDHGLVFKGTTYEEVTRMPLILSHASSTPEPMESAAGAGTTGTSARGRTVDGLYSSIDVAPTVLGLAGLDPPREMQGRSITTPSPSDGSPADRGAREAVLIENSGARRSVRTRDYLLTWHGAGTRGELYDLRTDPDCYVNLWDVESAAALKSEATDALLELLASNLDPRHRRLGAC